jgi:hypothetical protein
MGWIETLLTSGPLAAVGVVLFVTLVAAREAGGWLHRLINRRGGPAEGSDAEVGLILSGVVGLLSLLIGFTFSLSLTRYETRREQVTAEANAIETAFTRAQLLEAAPRAQLSAMLRAYAETRLKYGLAAEAEREPFSDASRAQRRALTIAAVEAARTAPTPAAGGLLIQAMDDLSDQGVERDGTLATHVPMQVLLVLLVYVVAAAMVLGYALQAHKGRHRVATAVLFLLQALALVTILDLDRPRGGFITVSQAPLEAVADDLR